MLGRGRSFALMGLESRRHSEGLARLEGLMAPVGRPIPGSVGPSGEMDRDGAWRRLRAPWRRGCWTPEEAARALRERRDELLREMRPLAATRGVPARALEEIADEAICAVVMKPRPIVDEEHLRRAFWRSVGLLMARYHEGRHRVRVGSRERVDFDVAVRGAPARGPEIAEEVEFKDRLARAADLMAQLDEFEAQVTAVMAVRGVGIKLAARELGVPVARVKAAVHSAQGKLEQIAVIAAAGRMCEYRERVIVAHASGAARDDEVRAARAHLAACAGCRRSYAGMVREMRRREFLRRASAAFLPMPMLAAGDHSGFVERLGAFVGARLPGGGMPVGSGPRERVLALLGSGAGAAKAAGVLAGAAIVVAGVAEVGGSDRPAHRPGHHVHASVLMPARASVHPAASATPRDLASISHVARISGRPGDGGFSYLGGGSTSTTTRKPSGSTKAARATGLQYLGAPSSGSATVASSSSSARQSGNTTSSGIGGQFSP